MPTQSAQRQVEHEITISAPAGAVYRLIADVRNWPRIFPPTIHVAYTQQTDHDEHIQIWATANGEARTWTSRRTLQPEQRRITFQQLVSAPPVASMSGAWLIEELSPDESRVRLSHAYRSGDDDPASLAWIDQAVDRNSRSELAALKTTVEGAHRAAELTFSFEDSVEIAGRLTDVFGFINEAGRWAQRLPHVATVRFEADDHGLQTLEMDTVAPDGSTHTTASYRVAFPCQGIAYKQIILPPLLSLHTGYWRFVESGGGVAATSQHTVVINAGNIARVLGPAAAVADAREYVRTALSANSRATLGYAKAYAEAAARTPR
jgi:aromatase